MRRRSHILNLAAAVEDVVAGTAERRAVGADAERADQPPSIDHVVPAKPSINSSTSTLLLNCLR